MYPIFVVTLLGGITTGTADIAKQVASTCANTPETNTIVGLLTNAHKHYYRFESVQPQTLLSSIQTLPDNTAALVYITGPVGGRAVIFFRQGVNYFVWDPAPLTPRQSVVSNLALTASDYVVAGYDYQLLLKCGNVLTDEEMIILGMWDRSLPPAVAAQKAAEAQAAAAAARQAAEREERAAKAAENEAWLREQQRKQAEQYAAGRARAEESYQEHVRQAEEERRRYEEEDRDFKWYQDWTKKYAADASQPQNTKEQEREREKSRKFYEKAAKDATAAAAKAQADAARAQAEAMKAQEAARAQAEAARQQAAREQAAREQAAREEAEKAARAREAAREQAEKAEAAANEEANAVNNLIRQIPTDMYVLLGVQRDASLNDIKKAYRRKILQYHTDKAPPGQFAYYNEYTKRLNRAYEVLYKEKQPKFDLNAGGRRRRRHGL